MNILIVGALTLVQTCELPAQRSSVPELAQSAPIAVFGSEQDPLYRITSAASDGTQKVAIGSSGSMTIIVYDIEEGTRTEFGRPGAGPAEFGALSAVYRSDEGNLVATDYQNHRAVTFDYGGEHLGTVTLQETGKTHKIIPFPDGRVVAQHASNPTDLLTQNGSRIRGMGPVTVHGTDGVLEGTLTSVPGIERIPSPNSITLAPFAKVSYVARLGGCVIVSTGEGSRMEIFGLDGESVGEVRLPASVTEPVTEEEYAARIDEYAAMVDDPRRAAQLRWQLRDDLPYDPARPPLSGLVVDDQGRIWAQPYYHREQEVEGWWVYPRWDEEPVWMEAPSGVSDLLDVNGQLLVTLAIDELGVETVKVFRIEVSG